MLSYRFDSALSNVLTGLGVRGRDANLANGPSSYGYYPDWDEQGEWRRRSWACRKLIDIPPRYMIREWGEYKVGEGKPEDAIALNDILKKLRIRQKFQKAQELANLRGNSGIILMLDDGRKASEPIDWARVKNTPELSKVYSCRYLRPDTTQLWSNLGEDDKPAAFHLSSSFSGQLVDEKGNQMLLESDRIHADRVLWFRGAELDEDTRVRNNLVSGCDDSVLVNFLDVWLRYSAGMESMATALQKSNVLMHGIDGLLSMLLDQGTDGQNKLGDRLRTNLLGMSAYRGVAYDKERESMQFLSPNLGGYGEAIDRLKDEMIAASNLAPSIFYLTFASGIDAAGKIHSEQQAINAELKSLQEAKFDDPINHLIKVIHAAKNGPTKGKEPESWSWEWRSLYAPSDSEKAQLRTQYAQFDTTYMGLAAAAGYTPDWEKAVLKSRFSKPEFETDLTVDFDELDRLAEERKAQEEEAAAAMEDFGVEEAPVEGEAVPEEEAPAEDIPVEDEPVENLDAADALTDKEWDRLAAIAPSDVLVVLEDIVDEPS